MTLYLDKPQIELLERALRLYYKECQRLFHSELDLVTEDELVAANKMLREVVECKRENE